MRKNLTFLLILGFKLCFAQSLINFADSTATWSVAKTFPAGTMQFPSFAATKTKTYGYISDTLIGTSSWNKIYFTNDSVFSVASNNTFAGYISSDNGFAFYIDTLFIVDTLYNFDLQIGDSVNYDFGAGACNTYLYVSTVDSIVINGVYHKRFFFTEPATCPNALTLLNEVWMEGIGSIHGPLFPHNPTVFSTENSDSMLLTCFKLNDSLTWSNPNYSDCYNNIVLSVHELNESNNEILVFPNPTSAVLKIDLPNNADKNFLVSIFDMQGKMIRQKNYRSIPIIIDVETLENNFYLLKVESEKRIYRTKFSKQ